MFWFSLRHKVCYFKIVFDNLNIIFLIQFFALIPIKVDLLSINKEFQLKNEISYLDLTIKFY